MAKIMVLALLCISYVAVCHALGDCPPKSQNDGRSVCYSDFDCGNKRKCCPNLSNKKSCVEIQGFKNNDAKYKGVKSGGTGTYCGNQKCMPYQKCEKDRLTAQYKCVSF